MTCTFILPPHMPPSYIHSTSCIFLIFDLFLCFVAVQRSTEDIYECDTYDIYADTLHHTGKIISFCSCSSHHLFFEDFFYSVSSTFCFQSSLLRFDHVELISLNSLDHELTLTRSRSVPFLIAMKAMRSDSPQDFSVVL